jgi:hypothetical protein
LQQVGDRRDVALRIVGVLVVDDAAVDRALRQAPLVLNGAVADARGGGAVVEPRERPVWMEGDGVGGVTPP